MGANAQTTVPTFTAGQVLTAAQQNASARTGVPVFADTTARDGAFGGSGEKVLAEGQLCYLEDLNVVQYYDGAAWATVGPAAPGGLAFINGATFTTVTSVNFAASTFTSTYRNYRVILHITAAASDTAATMRLRASGTDDSSNVYRWSALGLNDAGSASNVSSGGNNTSWQIVQTNTDPQPSTISFDLIAPQLATATLFHGTSSMSNSASGQILRIFAGRFSTGTQFDAASFLFAGNTSGVYRVYGYSDS